MARPNIPKSVDKDHEIVPLELTWVILKNLPKSIRDHVLYDAPQPYNDNLVWAAYKRHGEAMTLQLLQRAREISAFEDYGPNHPYSYDPSKG